jgi:hypothetical protein
MRMNGKVAIAMGATAVLAVLAACSDASTAPSVKSGLSTPSFAVGDVVNPTPAPVLGKIYVCKAGNANGSFDVTRVAVGASSGTTSGLNTAINTGQCKEVANDFGGDGVGSTVTIDEDPAANTVQTVTACSFQSAGGPVTSCSFTDGGSVFLNSFHAYVITYTNTFTPPPSTGCTFTKGFYRNHPQDVTAQDGRTLSQTQTILAATPGQPLGVTFGGDNLLLNLYQQYLTALINLDGAQPPNAIASTLTAVAAGTDGSGLNITTTLTQEQISDYTAILTNFNEGNVTGWPHCDD